MPPSYHTALRHCDVRFKTAVYVLVHRHALADGHEEEYIGGGIAAAVGAQALSALLGYDAQLRSVMGKRDDRYTLKGCIELDEGFFSTEMPMEQKNEKLKAGAGSQRKSKVLVIAESTPEEKPNSGQKPKSVWHIKMIVIPDAKATTIDAAVSRVIEGESSITTNASSSHIHFKDMFTEHTSQVIDPRDIGKVLPWVHIAIANAKTLLADMYHGVKPEFLQEYLNEFCYKFNRRYFGEDLFERLVMIAASCRTDFEHRTYRKAA